MTTETHVHYDDSERTWIFNRVQDVEPILERNKALQNEAQSSLDGFHHVAEIPNVILEKWLNEEWLRGNHAIRLGSKEFDQIVWKKLRDPDWQFLRVTNKRF